MLEESIEGVSDEFSAFVGDLGGLSLYQSSLDKMVEGLSATKAVEVPFSLRIDEDFIEKLRSRLGEDQTLRFFAPWPRARPPLS